VLVEAFTGGNVAVLSGAGLSTESGIPDYRGPTGQARLARSGGAARPMTYQEFTGSAAARQRYWARSHLGWRHVTGAAPNAGHRAVADLERAGLLSAIITQNVDGLHQAGGAAGVTELHGSLHRVVCLGCWERSPREELDARLRAANPAWTAASLPGTGTGPAVNPDGDVALEETAGFTVAGCLGCGGILKPDVVFFGENVPRPRADACFALVSAASSLVVLGSSLTVMSGFRYVRHAASLGIPVVIVNQGATRADALAAATLDAPLGPTLTALARALGPVPPRLPNVNSSCYTGLSGARVPWRVRSRQSLAPALCTYWRVADPVCPLLRPRDLHIADGSGASERQRGRPGPAPASPAPPAVRENGAILIVTYPPFRELFSPVPGIMSMWTNGTWSR
jgi:NAD-dependent SIR2 family protein deacetylase